MMKYISTRALSKTTVIESDFQECCLRTTLYV